MALSDLSFKTYTDSGLTTPFGGVKSLLHKTDLSDNPQDFVIYFGSLGSLGTNTTDRLLQAESNPGTDNITITPTYILPEWASATVYSLGDSVEPITPNGLRYVVIQAGTSGGSEPVFPVSGIGSTVVDNTVVWKLVGAVHSVSEIKLASTSGGLSSAVAGASLSLGATITSGTANVKQIWVRITNAVTTASNNSGTPELALYINEVQEVPA